MLRSKLILPGLAIALAGGAFAQGDDCSTAAALTGTGFFAYDTTGLTQSFFDGGGTCAGGASAMNVDGFYQWTAPAAGDYIFDTFGTSYDTKLSVHTGVGCAATCADYNDDTNGLQSEVSLTGLAAGDMVLIQVGGFGANHFGPGSLNITQYVAPPPLRTMTAQPQAPSQGWVLSPTTPPAQPPPVSAAAAACAQPPPSTRTFSCSGPLQPLVIIPSTPLVARTTQN